jgi:two-component system sensor histidine kinase PilS (NtrC family)
LADLDHLAAVVEPAATAGGRFPALRTHGALPAVRCLSAGFQPVARRPLRPMLGVSAVAASGSAIEAEEWRVLRLLSLYRLLLVGTLVALLRFDAVHQLFPNVEARGYQWTCTLYGTAALLLVALLQRRRIALPVQSHLQIGFDLFGLCLLLLFCGGISTGLGALLITPIVAAALVMSRRMALLHAANATLAVFAMELLRGVGNGLESKDFTAGGVLGLMLFGSSLAANTVALRARKSEALAARVGSEFQSLSELNESIVASMQTGVLVVDASGIIRSYNAAARRLLEFSHDLHGVPLERHSGEISERLARWRETGTESADPIPSRRRDGPEIVPRFSRLGSRRDVRSATLILLDDASRLREQAQQMKLAALGRLSANIAHEIRNPLSAIHHAGQLLAESDAFAEQDRGQERRLLQMMQRHGQRIEKIVSDVLAMSRREPPHRVPIALKAWLVRTAGLYQEGFPDQPRPIELLDVPETMTVRFDADQLQQILFNLWDNAFTHGASEGAAILVTLTAGHDAQLNPWLDITDNGPGIPESLRERMFEPFFTTAHQGTGLGLFLTRELCEYNQARVTYRPPPSGGACFRLTFTATV